MIGGVGGSSVAAFSTPAYFSEALIKFFCENSQNPLSRNLPCEGIVGLEVPTLPPINREPRPYITPTAGENGRTLGGGASGHLIKMCRLADALALGGPLLCKESGSRVVSYRWVWQDTYPRRPPDPIPP